jgi:hypothetical protein
MPAASLTDHTAVGTSELADELTALGTEFSGNELPQ